MKSLLKYKSIKNRTTVTLAVAIGVLALLFTAFKTKTDGDNVDWGEYLGGPDRNHYSPLTQINKENLKDLKVAWTYSMPDSGQMQVNPLIINGIMYGVTPNVHAFAVDATTGKQIWKFGEDISKRPSHSRGVCYWTDGKEKRIFHTIDSYIYAINAENGNLITSFGNNGRLDLHTGLPASAQEKFLSSNTPATTFNNLIIVPLRMSEGADAAPGDIRAFDVRTGKLVWTFHTIPHPGEYGYETFPKDAYKNRIVGGANNWSGMSIDRKRGILFVPTGSSSDDFYGGARKGTNLFANCLIALDAKTGKRLWHFQTMHHDIWDRDLPAPPNLATITKNGKKIDVVAQITKHGYVYVFDRVTGKPIYPIKEISVPASKLKGEAAWKTQPVPTKPVPFARQAYQLTENDINPYSTNKDQLLKIFRQIDKRLYGPPSKEGTMILPGYDGGGEWGGAAVDPDGILYVNNGEMPWILTMIDTPRDEELLNMTAGERLYQKTCSVCHGKDRKGNADGSFPSLVNVNKRLDRATLLSIIGNGKGRMPGQSSLNMTQKQAIADYILGLEKKEASLTNADTKMPYLPYSMTGYNKFLDENGHPAISPPWGTLNAIDLNTGEFVWKKVLGEEPKLGIKGTGTENYGGPVVTASGLLFIAATKDEKFRIFDKKTGELLWETTLPAASFATPATYQANGKQYIVLSCGGTKLGTKKGNTYIAFSL